MSTRSHKNITWQSPSIISAITRFLEKALLYLFSRPVLRALPTQRGITGNYSPVSFLRTKVDSWRTRTLYRHHRSLDQTHSILRWTCLLLCLPSVLLMKSPISIPFLWLPLGDWSAASKEEEEEAWRLTFAPSSCNLLSDERDCSTLIGRQCMKLTHRSRDD